MNHTANVVLVWLRCSPDILLLKYWLDTFAFPTLPAATSFLHQVMKVVEFFQRARRSLGPYGHILHGAMGRGGVTEFGSALAGPM